MRIFVQSRASRIRVSFAAGNIFSTALREDRDGAACYPKRLSNAAQLRF